MNVSVILPTYNRGYCITRSVKSVLSQSYTDYEVLIIDDGSTDDTESVVSKINDDRIRYIRKENAGAASARNLGIKEAKGQYLAFQDSDDIWLQDKLKLQVQMLEADASLAFCYHKFKYDELDDSTAVPPDIIPMERKTGNILDTLLYENIVGCPTLMVRMSAVEDAGLFDTDMKALEDYEFVLRLCKRGGKAGFIQKILLNATTSKDSISMNHMDYLMSSCTIVGKYLKDYLDTGTFDHRVTAIFEHAGKVGMQEEIMAYLEKSIKLYS